MPVDTKLRGLPRRPTTSGAATPERLAHRRWPKAAACAALLALMHVPARAQQDPVAVPSLSFAQSSPPGAIREQLTPRAGLGVPAPPSQPVQPGSIWATLHDQGITVRLLYLDELLANPNYGLIPGSTSNTGILLAGFDLDMNRIAGVRGGQFHLLESVQMFKSNTVMNRAIGSGIGGLEYITVPVSNTLAVATYEQKLADDRLDIEVGRSNPQRYFAIPNCDNVVSCQQSIISFDANVPPPRFASWMGRASYNVTRAAYLQAGLFEQDFANNRTSGFHFGDVGDTGLLGMGEIGYKTDTNTTPYPERYELGGYYNDSPHKDPNLTNRFLPTVTHRTAPALKRFGDGGLFLLGQKIVWRADGGQAPAQDPRHLTLYGQFLHDTSPTVAYSDETEIGLNYVGFIPHRSTDRVGIKLRTLSLTSSEQSFQQAAHVAAGGRRVGLSPDQYDFEVNGHFQLTQYAAIEPTAQYILHSDSFFNPYTRQTPKDGFLLSALLIVYLGQLIGAPSLNGEPH